METFFATLFLHFFHSIGVFHKAFICNTIRNNTVSFYSFGGGIYFNNCHNLTMVNNIIAYNIADKGGGIYCDSSSLAITNNTISGNQAGYLGGGGIYCCDNSSLVLTNTILWGNTPQEIVFPENDNPNTVSISYSDVKGGETEIITNSNRIIRWLEGNIDANPFFISIENNNYHLFNCSPCIGAGCNINNLIIDIEGNTRGVPCDIGACENPLNAPVEIHSPVIITETLPDALVNNSYVHTLNIEDPDEGDSFIFEILVGPEWLSINNLGELSGIPQREDAGFDITISIKVFDCFERADTLITVINVNEIHSPVIITETLPDAFVNNSYVHTLIIEDPDEGDSFTFEIIMGPEWLSINNSGVLSGIPQMEDIGYDISVSIVVLDCFERADTLITVINVAEPIFVDNAPIDFIFNTPYPNPFNLTTTIEYTIPKEAIVNIQIYNTSGQSIVELKNEIQPSGRHIITWNASDMPNGLYFCTLKTDALTKTKKMLLLK